MLNSASARADIYGLLRFGRFRPWNDWNAFNEHVVSAEFAYMSVNPLSPLCLPGQDTK